MTFNAYVPPRLADWLLALVERGTFADPSEAAFVMLEQCRELEPHNDLRRELLSRSLQAAMGDPQPGIPADEVFGKLKRELASPMEPAVWET